MSPESIQHGGHAPSHTHDPTATQAGAAMRSHEVMRAAPAGGMMAMAHGQGTVWPHFANMALGVWLITGAFAMGYGSSALQVSDVASGVLVVLLAALSLSHRHSLSPWPYSPSLSVSAIC